MSYALPAEALPQCVGGSWVRACFTALLRKASAGKLGRKARRVSQRMYLLPAQPCALCGSAVNTRAPTLTPYGCRISQNG
jgi:hypothetical protein